MSYYCSYISKENCMVFHGMANKRQIFKYNFPLPKNGGHFEFFEFLPKMAKHKFASISLTMQDRAIFSKFPTHRVSEQCTFGNFQTKFPLPKHGGHFEFSNFCQKWKNTNLLLSP